MWSLRRASHATQASEVGTPQELQGPVPAAAQGRQAAIMALRAVWQLILSRRCSKVSLKKGGFVRQGEAAHGGVRPEKSSCRDSSAPQEPPKPEAGAGGTGSFGPSRRRWPTAVESSADSWLYGRSSGLMRVAKARTRTGGAPAELSEGQAPLPQGWQGSTPQPAARFAQGDLALDSAHGSTILGGVVCWGAG